jgi:hypothetical protein
MTPNDIEILIHCYVSPSPHPRIEHLAVLESMEGMKVDGLLFFDGMTDGLPVYTTTPMGEAHMKNLCALRYPVQKWVLPE